MRQQNQAMRYTAEEHDAFAADLNRDSLVILRNHIPRAKLTCLAAAFRPLWQAQIAREPGKPSRGIQRFYVTLPFGTHRMNRPEAMTGLASGAIAQHRLPMAMGDVMIRDVRAVHRGIPNSTDEPRPMVVLGYSRRWYFRPEVNIRVPQSQWDALSTRGRRLLRYNPVVPDAEAVLGDESYRVFAY